MYINNSSTVLKLHQAGKATSSPCHSGDSEKSHQVVESHIVPRGREHDRFFAQKVYVCRKSRWNEWKAIDSHIISLDSKSYLYSAQSAHKIT